MLNIVRLFILPQKFYFIKNNLSCFSCFWGYFTMHLKQICVMHCIWTPTLQESFVGHNESLHLSRYFPCFMEFEGSSLFYNSLPLFPVLNLSNIVQGLISYALKICFYLTFSHIPMSSKWPHYFRFLPSKPCMHFPSSLYMPHALSISFSSISLHNIWWVQGLKFLFMQFLQCPVTSAPSGQNILLSTLFSNTLTHTHARILQFILRMQWFIICIYLYIIFLLNVNVWLPHCVMEESVIKHSSIHILGPSPDLTQNKSFVTARSSKLPHFPFFPFSCTWKCQLWTHFTLKQYKWQWRHNSEFLYHDSCQKSHWLWAVWQRPNSWQKQKYHTGAEAHPASYPVGTEDSSTRWKTARVGSWPFTICTDVKDSWTLSPFHHAFLSTVFLS